MAESGALHVVFDRSGYSLDAWKRRPERFGVLNDLQVEFFDSLPARFQPAGTAAGRTRCACTHQWRDILPCRSSIKSPGRYQFWVDDCGLRSDPEYEKLYEPHAALGLHARALW